jgi:hypothetical protein
MKVVRIEIEYEDGSVWYQEGDGAEQVMAWYRAAEAMYVMHGAVYGGEILLKRQLADGNAAPKPCEEAANPDVSTPSPVGEQSK